MRCPDCNKFVSYNDPPDVEIIDTTIDGDTVTVELRVVLTCNECGGELKDSEGEIEITIEHECDKPAKDGETARYEVEDDFEGEGTSRQQTKDRHGKPIKSSRYMKTFYGADVHGSVKCLRCEEVIELSDTFEEQASGFNELV